MSKTATIVLVVLVLLAGVGAFIVLGSSDDDTADESASANNDTSEQAESESEDSSEDSSEPEAESVDAFSEADVAIRSSEDDCWTIVNGNVYDITDYIPRHPGGDTILQACGADGTTLFTERTTEDGETVGSGTPHSSGAAAQLESFLIGELAE